MTPPTKAVEDDEDFEEEAPGLGHNSPASTLGNQIAAYVRRIENIETDIAELNDDKKEVYGEAKAIGLDKNILRKLVAKRKKDPEAAAEEEELLALYEAAMRGG